MNPSSPSSSASLRNCLLLALVLVYFTAVYHGVLFTTQGVFERDGFFHARYSQMLPERGLSRAFPWMQFTTWKDHYSDKDVLYHVLLVPFCRNAAEPLPGAKWSTLVFGCVAYVAFYWVLKKLRAPAPLLWTLLLIVGSAFFLHRMLMVRSHLLSVVLMIVSTYFILKDRARWTFALGFIYAWSYSMPLALVITAAAAAIGRFVAFERSIRAFKLPALAAAGVGLGLVIHPYSPYSITNLWMFLNISSSRAMGIPLQLGTEFDPLFSTAFLASPREFLKGLLSLLIAVPGPLLALIFAATVAALIKSGRLKHRTLSNESVVALAMAGAWLFATLFVLERLIEYAAPLSILAAALVCRDAWGEWLAPPMPRVRKLALLCGALIPLIGLHWLSLEAALELVNSTRPHYPAQIFISDAQWKEGRFFSNSKDGGAVKWLRDHVPAHSTIVNFHWDDFPELYYSAPDYYFIVGLDPTFMRLPYPEQSATLEAMRTRQIPLDFARLHQLFNANYLIMRNTRAAEYPELKHGQIAPVYADEGAVIYKID